MRHVLCLLLLLVSVDSALAQGVGSAGKEGVLARLTSPKPVAATDISWLLDQLASRNADVRVAALRFWAERGDEVQDCLREEREDREDGGSQQVDLVSPLVAAVDRCVDAPEGRVRREAIRTLCALGTAAEEICPPGDGCGTGFEMTLEGRVGMRLSKRSASCRAELMSLVEDPDPTVVMNAVGALTPKDRKDAEPRIRRLFAHKDKLFRAVGLSLLRPSSDEDALRTVGPLLDDPDEDVQKCAWSFLLDSVMETQRLFPSREKWSGGVRAFLAESIGRYGGEGREEMLFAMLPDRDGRVRARAVRHLGVSEDGERPSLLEEAQVRPLLRDPHPEVRAAALIEMSRRKPQDRRELLTAGLTDPVQTVREAAALCCLDDFDLGLTDAAVTAVEMGVAEHWVLSKFFIDPANEPRLDGWLASENVSVRRAAANAIWGDEVPARFLPRLLRMARDPDPKVVRFAISALGSSSDPAAFATLKEIAARSRGDQLAEAVRALARTGLPAAAGVVRGYLKSSDKAVRRAAKRALKDLGEATPP